MVEIGIIKLNWFNLCGSSSRHGSEGPTADFKTQTQTLMEYISKRFYFFFGIQKIGVLSYKHVVILEVYEQWDHELYIIGHTLDMIWYKESPHDKQFICWKEKYQLQKSRDSNVH